MSEAAPIIKKSDKYIPYYFVLFFVVIAIVDGVFVTVALQTHTGVVSHQAYEEGLAYNDILDASKTQDSLGWQSSLSLNSDQTTLILELKDNQGQIIEGAAARAVIDRPIQEGLGFDVSLTQQGGQYFADVAFPMHGEWDVRVYISQGDATYQTSKRFVVGY